MKNQERFYPKLARYMVNAVEHIDEISKERKILLDDLARYIIDSKRTEETVNLTFICTHNSRRSHMAELWALAAAAYYEIPDINCFSGGTEATTFNPNAIEALSRAGMKIDTAQNGDNPLYEAKIGAGSEAHKMWSKKYDDALNPSQNFAAIMVCTDADQNCPYVPGATRLAIPFDDPKAFDGTPSESAKYDERCFQIATEMLYVMNQVKMNE